MFAKAIFSFLLKNAHQDALIMYLPKAPGFGQPLYFGRGSNPAIIEIVKPLAMLKKLYQSGSIGLGESYMAGDWQTPNLPRFLLWTARNQAQLAFRFGQKSQQHHWQKNHAEAENTLRQSPKNITYHYDLGNDFYKLWLDASMTYSSACFCEPGQSLESAQAHKYQKILTVLHAKPGQHILEIGCGWGSFIEVATQQQLQVTGITLSPAQAIFAKQRSTKIASADLAEKSVITQDYRHTQGQFDHIVSIEMFEIVSLAANLISAFSGGGAVLLSFWGNIAGYRWQFYCSPLL